MANDRGPMLNGISWIESVLVVIAIIVRFYVRVKIIHEVRLDDWTMLGAVVLQLLGQAFLTVAIHSGLGRHSYALTPFLASQAVKFGWIWSTSGLLISSVGRTSVAIFIYRIFGSKDWLRWYLWITASLQAAVVITMVVVVWIQCSPVAAVWGGVPGRCWDPKVEQNVLYLYQAIASLLDLTYVVFPVFVICRLQMDWNSKITVVLVLSFGLLTFAASIIKTVKAQDLTDRRDFLYKIVDLCIWASTEQCLIIVTGCVPTIRKLFTHRAAVVPRLKKPLFSKHSSHSRLKAPPPATLCDSKSQPLSWTNFELLSTTHFGDFSAVAEELNMAMYEKLRVKD